MSLAKVLAGKRLLILIGDGAEPETFAHPCLINAARGITLSAESNTTRIPDCDDPELMAWAKRQKVALSATISGAGVLHMPNAEYFSDWFASADAKNVHVSLDGVLEADGGGLLHGAFILTSFEVTGDLGGYVQASITLESDGEIAWAGPDDDIQDPYGYAISFTADAYTVLTDADEVDVAITGAEVGDDWTVTIRSTGGGDPVVETGTVGSTSFTVSDIDISGLEVGTVTATIELTDPSGNIGDPADDTASLYGMIESEFYHFRGLYLTGADTDDTDMLSTTAVSKLIVAATKGKYAVSSNTAATNDSSLTSTLVQIGPASCTELRLEINNWWLLANSTEEQINSAVISVEAVLVDLDSGLRVRFKFSTANIGSVPITSGAARLVSDALLPASFGLAVFPAFSRWCIVVRRTANSSSDALPWDGQYGELSRQMEYDYWYPSGSSSAATVAAAYLDNRETLVQHIKDNSNNIVGLAHAPGRPNVSSSTLSSVGGIILLGKTNAATRAIAIIGDSIADGSGDGTAPVPTDLGPGWFSRALVGSDGYPLASSIKATIASDRAQYAAAVNTLRRNAMAKATHVVIALGNNDVFGSRTSTQIRDDLRTLATLAKAQGASKVIMALVTPRTSSTDSWVTTANQTVVTNFGVSGLRDTVNAQIISDVTAGTHDMDDYIDFSSVIEESGTRKWLANMTADGVHPNATAAALMAGVARTKFAALAKAIVV